MLFSANNKLPTITQVLVNGSTFSSLITVIGKIVRINFLIKFKLELLFFKT